MDGQTDMGMDGWMDGHDNRQADTLMDGRTDGDAEGWTDRQTEVMDGWVDG